MLQPPATLDVSVANRRGTSFEASTAAALGQIASEVLLDGVNTVFETLGRALVCLDRDLNIVHASDGVDRLLGAGAATRLVGLPAAAVLGPELFGIDGSLRRALLAGERREGWGATLHLPPAPPRLVSLTGAPLCRPLPSVCQTRVTYLLVLRPAPEDLLQGAGGSAPTLFSGLIARSPAMLAVIRLIQNLAESEATVLVTGESGTGKELVARALHLHSARRSGPFVAVNVAALPGELLESELFGHVRGAFTGAFRDRIGRFEAASEGTLFLDEVGDLPLPLQVKLLRVLQERTFEAVGETRSRRTEARLIAATHRDLRQEIAAGRFRDDLYYRLRVVPIHLPPLRERREDVEPLARLLLDRVASRYGRSLLLGPDALRALLGYPWPGNVRELENALEYAVAVSRGQTLHEGDLPPEILGVTAINAAAHPATGNEAWSGGQHPPLAVAGAGRQMSAGLPAVSLQPTNDELAAERERLRSVLAAHRWRRNEAAQALGISRTTLWRRLRELGLADG
jgi:DNA-binding NtrC family response regulator